MENISKNNKVNNNIKYPIAFLTTSNFLFMKSSSKISADGTPRYIPNPNSDKTYCLQDCLEDYTPVYTKSELKKHQNRSCK